MIVSHKYKYVFVKTRKTAGTSIQVALWKYRGDQDSTTKLPGVADFKVQNPIGGLGSHTSAKKIKNKIGLDKWKEYFTFAFERNPWDKVVSAYWHQYSRGLRIEFTPFCIKAAENSQKRKVRFSSYSYNKVRAFPIDWGKYTESNKVIVDFMGKYENLKKDLRFVCDKLKIPWDGKLTKELGNFRKDKSSYRKYYNEHTKDLVNNLFRKEIELFGYKF